jgi:flagellar protein FliO/FliZ
MSSNSYFTMILALVFVLALMGLLAFVLKRLGLGGPVAQMGNKKRLQLVEVLPLTAQHRAVLIKRDNVEHLVVLGPGGDTVVESGLTHEPSQ